MDKKSAIAFSLSPIVVSAIGFLFIPVLSWWLPEGEMAKFAIYQTNANFFALTVSLGLDQALAREFHEVKKPSGLLKEILKIVLTAIPIGIITLIVIKVYTTGIASTSITTMMIASCVLMALSRIYSSFIRMAGKGVAYAFDIVTPKAIQLSLILLIGSQSSLALTYDVVVGIIVVSSLTMLFYEIFTTRSIGKQLDLRSNADRLCSSPCYLDLLKFSAPLVPGAIAYYAISASALYVIGLYGTPREVVTVSLAISVGGGVAVLQSVFATLWMPFAYRWQAANGSFDLYKSVATIVTMACAALMLISLFIVPLLTLAFPEKYSGVENLVVLVIAWNLLYLVSVVGSFGIGVKRKSLTSMTISIIGATLSISGSIIATNHFGALGTLLSVLLAFIATLVMNCEFSSLAWHRIVEGHHYLMTLIVVTSAILFSLGHATQAEILLASSILMYAPKFWSSWLCFHQLRKNSVA